MATRTRRQQRQPSTPDGYEQSTLMLPAWIDDYIRRTAVATRRSNSLVASEVLAAGIGATDPSAVPTEQAS